MTSRSGTTEVFYLLLHFLDKQKKEKIVSFNAEKVKQYCIAGVFLPVNILKNLSIVKIEI